MNERPHQPRQEAAGAQPAPLQHGVILTDNGHVTLVKVVERTFDLPPLQLLRDQPPDVSPFLNRRLRHARHWMSVLHDGSGIADDEHSGRVHDCQERVNERSPRTVGFGTEHFWDRRCRDARGPQHSCARNPASAGDHALFVDLLHLDVRRDLHAKLLEAL